VLESRAPRVHGKTVERIPVAREVRSKRSHRPIRVGIFLDAHLAKSSLELLDDAIAVAFEVNPHEALRSHGQRERTDGRTASCKS
jgi:hypothetical protein